MVDWSMSAALENVQRGSSTLAEVTSLEQAVREWLGMPANLRDTAELTPEHPIQMSEEGPTLIFRGEQIGALAARLPAAQGHPEV